MQKTEIGGVSVPIIGQGTYGIGGRFRWDARGETSEVESLKYGISLGMTLIDTAEIYGSGLSEEIVGKAIARFKRDELFIASKVWTNHLSYDDVIKSCKKSIQRMKSDYIDLYQIHWPDESTPIRETMSAFEKLASEGLIRGIGVSNFSARQLEGAMGVMSKYKIVSNQIPYSLDTREIEREDLPFCRKNKVEVIAYSPLGQGDLLSGPKSKVLQEVAAGIGRTKAQVALNWIVSKGVICIPKAVRKEHVKENSEASDFKLSRADMELLEK